MWMYRGGANGTRIWPDDRLVHNAEIIAIDGDSYRRKEAEERQKQRSAERRRRREARARRKSGKGGGAAGDA